MGSTELLRFADQADEQDTRSRMVMDFTLIYNDLFNPPDYKLRMTPEERILAAFDIKNQGLGGRDIYRPCGNDMLLIPYADLDRKITEIMKRDLNPQLAKLPFKESEGFLQVSPTNLPLNLARSFDRRVHLLSNYFILSSDAHMQRGVQRINVFDINNGDEIGEIWLGKKWMSVDDLPDTQMSRNGQGAK